MSSETSSLRSDGRIDSKFSHLSHLPSFILIALWISSVYKHKSDFAFIISGSLLLGCSFIVESIIGVKKNIPGSKWIEKVLKDLIREGSSNGIPTATGLSLLIIMILPNILRDIADVNTSENFMKMGTLQLSGLVSSTISLSSNSTGIRIAPLLTYLGSFAYHSLFLGPYQLFWSITPLLITFSLLITLPRCFSMAEAFVLSMVLSNGSFYCLAVRFPTLSEWDVPSDAFAKYGSSSLLSTMTAVAFLAAASRKRVASLNPLTFLLTISVAYVIGHFSIYSELPRLIKILLREERIFTMIRWLSLLIMTAVVTWITVSSTNVASPSTTSQTANNILLQLRRKFYHIVVVLLFTGGSIRDPDFLKFAMSIAICLFVTLESFRSFCNENPLSVSLTRAMDLFRSQLDEGGPILSHLWLLWGCSLPLFFSTSSLLPPFRYAGLSGTLSLGILDSAAAVFGSIIRGPQWPGSKKTISGSLVGLLCHLAGQVAVSKYYFAQFTTPWTGFIVNSIICSLWEATSDQNDNLMLPIISFITNCLYLY